MNPIDARPAVAREAGSQPLAARGPVRVRRHACLRARLAADDCAACAEACPTQALTVGPDGPLLGTGCTGCGRCQAACAMAALAVDGFDEAAVAVAEAGAATLTVECARTGGGSVRLPCLGGLSAGRLLGLCAASPDSVVVLVDRGACATCDSGGGDAHPAAPTLAQVVGWLQQAGVPASRLPRLEARGEGGRRRTADPLQVGGRARRGWITAFARAAQEPAARAVRPTQTGPSAERLAVLTAIESLAVHHGGRVPDSLFHQVRIGADCRGHRACASACPTGALRRYRDDAGTSMGVAFDAAACVGCGHCAAVCPERALRVLPGLGSAPAGRRPLNRFEPRECVDCAARFARPIDGDETRCARCRASAALVRSAAASLWRARP